MCRALFFGDFLMKKVIKFLFVFALSVALICCFVGCSNKKNNEGKNGQTATEIQTAT